MLYYFDYTDYLETTAIIVSITLLFVVIYHPYLSHNINYSTVHFEIFVTHYDMNVWICGGKLLHSNGIN